MDVLSACRLFIAVFFLSNDKISISIQLKIGFHGEYTIDSQLCKFLITLNTNKKNVERKRDRQRETESYVFHSRIFFYIAKNVLFTLFNELTVRRVDLICALFHEKDILKVCT